MQIFSVEFCFNYKGELVQDVTATLTFEVDTFADLWMQLEMGEKDGSTKQRLLDTMAEAEVDVQFDSFGFGNIYNQVGELAFDINIQRSFNLHHYRQKAKLLLNLMMKMKKITQMMKRSLKHFIKESVVLSLVFSLGYVSLLKSQTL